MTAFSCPVCDYVYDETKGRRGKDSRRARPCSEIPDDWTCPDCGVREKVDFE